MKKIKIIMIIVLILIVLLLGLIYILDKKTEDNSNKNIINNINNEIQNTIENDQNIFFNDDVSELQENDTENKYGIIKNVNNKSYYFCISSIVDKYVNCIGNSMNDDLNKIICSNDNFEQIKKSENIPALNSYKEYYTLVPIDIKYADIEPNVQIYIVKYKGRIVGREESNFSVNIMIQLNTMDSTYLVYSSKYLKENGFDKLIINNKIDYKSIEIEKNDGNSFSYNEKEDIDIARYYFNILSEFLVYYPEDAYQLLDEEFKSNKYQNFKEFKDNYINNNQYIIYTMYLDKYTVYENDNYKEYICTDQYGNYYVLRENNKEFLNSIFLDNYSIKMERFEKKYKKANEASKIEFNISQFIQMINIKDYYSIYNRLNETFKKNELSTIDKLRIYVQENAYQINSITINDYTKQDDYYVCNCILINQENKEETKNMNIIIKLIDSTNFELSFSF